MNSVATIVGGGLAGLSAALFLRRKRIEVRVIEAKCGVIDRVCGEGILPFGVEILEELGLAKQARARGRVLKGIKYLCGKRVAVGRFDGKTGIGVPRHELHQIFRAACKNEGVELCEGRSVSVEEGWVDARGLRALRERSPMITSRRVGARMRLNIDIGDRVCVAFEPFGEIYMTPIGPQQTSVAFLVYPNCVPPGVDWSIWLKAKFESCFPEYGECPLQDFAVRAPIAGFSTEPLGSRKAVGDSLCAFDPISGSGMSFALLSAYHLAQYWQDQTSFVRAIQPAIKAIDSFTGLLLWCSGGGWRSSLMTRQLARRPALFNEILRLHDAKHQVTDLGALKLGMLITP